jgi:hypothetical protein
LGDYTDWIRANGYGDTCSPIPTLYLPKIAGRIVDIQFMTNCWGIPTADFIPEFSCKPIHSAEIVDLELAGADPSLDIIIGCSPHLSHCWKMNYWPMPEWCFSGECFCDLQRFAWSRGLGVNNIAIALWFIDVGFREVIKPDNRWLRVATAVDSKVMVLIKVSDDRVNFSTDVATCETRDDIGISVSGIDKRFLS